MQRYDDLISICGLCTGTVHTFDGDEQVVKGNFVSIAPTSLFSCFNNSDYNYGFDYRSQLKGKGQ